MRYIDADKIPRHGKRGGECYWQEIEQLPTADVVEVVRCKDCKKYNTDDCMMIHGKKMNRNIFANDYCSCGKKRDD